MFQGRVDILVSEDRKIHTKALSLGIQDKVFRIDAFLEKVVSENPDLIDYSVLSVTKKHFGDIDLSDQFFDSFRDDYPGFDGWFNKKADEVAYVTHKGDAILSFLYVKVENESENYSDISPAFSPKRRLKVGTFKVVSNGVRLGERFLKIIFDNAVTYGVVEIYVTIFEKTDDQKRLIDLLTDWGFVNHGTKTTANGDELVFVRDFTPSFVADSPKFSYPYVSTASQAFLCPIYPDYHTELFPDSILTTESALRRSDGIKFTEAQLGNGQCAKIDRISASIAAVGGVSQNEQGTYRYCAHGGTTRRGKPFFLDTELRHQPTRDHERPQELR